jgi:hypothetical protein
MHINWRHPLVLTLLFGVPLSHFSITGYRYLTNKGETDSEKQDQKLEQIYQAKIQEQNYRKKEDSQN